MTRQIPEWHGKTDDTAIPPAVRLRVFRKTDGRCAKCTRVLLPGHWACDHIVALVNGGKHAESNLQPLCTSPCHSQKTKADVAEKSRVARVRGKHIGAFAPRAKIQSPGFRKAAPQKSASRPLKRRVHGEPLTISET